MSSLVQFMGMIMGMYTGQDSVGLRVVFPPLARSSVEWCLHWGVKADKGTWCSGITSASHAECTTS